MAGRGNPGAVDVQSLAMNPAFATVSELSAAFTGRTLSPVDVVDALLRRIERIDATLHAFIAVYAADARLAAEAADRAIRSGHAVGPLHGVPIALKDLVDLEGRVTTGGSKVWEKRVSPVTATLARRLIAAGMIVLGKTHTVEFAMGGWGTNTHMGTPRNPWDPQVHRTPGGSSSGSGVAVAAGLAPAAIGTDTGGSVRLPASWCGIVGLKVTAGRISTYGVLPLSSTLDTPGPLTRSVEDAALIYRVLNGPDPHDPATAVWAPDDPLPTLRRGVSGLRLAVMPEAERAGVDGEVLAAYDAAIAVLRGQGAAIMPVARSRIASPTTRPRRAASSAPRATGSSGTSWTTRACPPTPTCGLASSSAAASPRATTCRHSTSAESTGGRSPRPPRRSTPSSPRPHRRPRFPSTRSIKRPRPRTSPAPETIWACVGWPFPMDSPRAGSRPRSR